MSKNIIIVLLLIIGFSFDSWGQENIIPAVNTAISAANVDTTQVESKAEQEVSAVKIKLDNLGRKLNELKTFIDDSLSKKINCISISDKCPNPSSTTIPATCNTMTCIAQAKICSTAELEIAKKYEEIIKDYKNANESFSKIYNSDHQIKCTQSHSKGDFLCALTTSPYAQMGTSIMNQLAAQLASTGSAKETCDSTNRSASMAQTTLAAGGVACSMQRRECMSSCGNTTQELKSLQTALRNIEAGTRTVETAAAKAVNAAQSAGVACPIAQEAAQSVSSNATDVQRIANQITITSDIADDSIVGPLLGTDSGYLAKCSNDFQTGLSQIMGTAQNLLQSSLQAKACSEQLAGSNMTTAQLCAIAANANSTMCKCQADNKAPGCPGAIAQVAGGNLKALNTGGVSSLASLGSGNKVGSGDSGLDLSGLGEDAKRELEKLDESSSSMFGSAGGASAGGLGTSPAGTAPGAAGAAEEGSSIGSKFANAMGSLMRGAGFGGGFGGGAKPSNSKIQADQYNKIQRKLAAEQFGKEVSGASGLTNFEKINRRYTSNIPTFLSGE